MSGNYALRLEGVQKSFGRKSALVDLSMEVFKGTICGLVGPNGAGKTTTFGIICGFLKPDGGQIDVLGEGPFHPAKHRGRLTALPQDAALGRDLKLDEQLEYFARLQGLDGPHARREVARILEVVDLKEQARDRIRTLSHGMLHRLGIGQAFLGEPELVLLDEPTNGVDPHRAHQIRNFLHAQRGQRTIIISSHNLHEIENLCDQVVLIDAGRVVRSGTVAEVTGQDQEIRIRLSAGPVPLASLEEKLTQDTIHWNEETRLLLIRFAPSSERAAEEVIGEALRILLEANARVAEVGRGQSLERAYLESTGKG